MIITALWYHRELTLLNQLRGKLQGAAAGESQQAADVRRANVALALLRLSPAEVPGEAWDLFRDSEDPSVRSHILARLGPAGVPARVVADRLLTEPSVSARRALIVALGEFTGDQLDVATRERLGKKLLEWYKDDPDPGVHGAIDWLLRHSREGETPRLLDWGLRDQLKGLPVGYRPKFGWYVNGQGQTFVVVKGPIRSLIGTKDATRKLGVEDERPAHIDRNFAIGMYPVTVGEWTAFLQDKDWKKHRDELWKNHPENNHPDKDSEKESKEYYNEGTTDGLDYPIVRIDAYAAMLYCNWLSYQDRIPTKQWCYPILPISREMNRAADDADWVTRTFRHAKLPPDYTNLQGYRLATDHECEVVCRANTTTRCYFGNPESLLERYAWFSKNAPSRRWPVGQKRPNPWGLFDMHGLVWQWCVSPGLNGLPETTLCGGSTINHAPQIVSWVRNPTAPDRLNRIYGFRVVRTIPPTERVDYDVCHVDK
jgi:formylglycine-generating enzyme required for sulfatase activity